MAAYDEGRAAPDDDHSTSDDCADDYEVGVLYYYGEYWARLSCYHGLCDAVLQCVEDSISFLGKETANAKYAVILSTITLECGCASVYTATSCATACPRGCATAYETLYIPCPMSLPSPITTAV